MSSEEFMEFPDDFVVIIAYVYRYNVCRSLNYKYLDMQNLTPGGPTGY